MRITKTKILNNSLDCHELVRRDTILSQRFAYIAYILLTNIFNMMKSKIRLLSFVIIYILCIVGTNELTLADDDEEEENKIPPKTSLLDDMQPLVDEVNTLIKDKYIVENVSNQKLADGAIDGMLRGLDPYSSYFNEDEFKNFKNNTSGKYCGIGIETVYDINSDCPIITAIFNGSPASKAKLAVGDIITHVDDVAINGKKNSIVVKMIKGKRGTQVKLTLYRSSTGETFSRTLRRGDVKIPNVVSKVYKDRIAVISIKLFNKQTYSDFVAQINEIRNQQYDIRGIILDLRNNPGGLLQSAVDIANLFVSNGQLITSIRGRNGEKIFNYVAKNKEKAFADDVKVVVLINKGSASAAEILAGCLQDHGIATLIGEQSFGKALVQEVFRLKNSNGAVKLTTGQYHTPKDRQINGVGIVPDIRIEERKIKGYDAILQAGLNFLDK